mgnify:CR=1 FL=1
MIYSVLFILFLLIVVYVVLLIGRPAVIGGNNAGGSVDIHVQEPWYTEIESGRKTIEGRSGNVHKYTQMIGNYIVISSGKKSCRKKVIAIRTYDTLEEFIDKEGWKNMAPQLLSKEQTTQAYLNVQSKEGVHIFSPSEVQRKGGMIAIEFE